MFYPLQIPGVPAFGFLGGPEFSTNVQTLASGKEKRNGDWDECKHKFTAPFSNITQELYLGIKQVHLMMRGKLHSFLFKDWGDFQANAAPFGFADGVTTVYQLAKISSMAGVSYTRKVTKIAIGAVVQVGGVATAVSIDNNTGLVTFPAAPAEGAALTWTGEFFVQVRFDVDYLPFTLADKNGSGYVTNGSVDLVEVDEP